MNSCTHRWETVSPTLLRCKLCGAEVGGGCCPEKDRRIAELERKLEELKISQK